MTLDSKEIYFLCDLREFYPLEFENYFVFRFLETDFRKALCQNYLKKCDITVTVSEGLADGYKMWFDIEPLIIYSTPLYCNLLPQQPDNSIIKCVHHGAANRDRKLENMIYMFEELDKKFCLDFYLVGDRRYIYELQEISRPFSDRIKFLQPIPFNEIIQRLNKYDIGLYLLKDTNFNTRYSLPNKFFEYIQARLMLAIGPSPDMSKIVKTFKLGIVGETFNPHDLARELNKLSLEAIFEYKKNSNIASSFFCYEHQSKVLKAKLLEMLNNRGIDVN